MKMRKGWLLVFLGFTAQALAQGAGLAPRALDGLPAPLDRDNADGFERQSGVPLEMQKVCPTAAGDYYERTSDEDNWNTVEAGIMFDARTGGWQDLQLYTRYTCPRPLDRPQ